jgi:hypothetical protein
VWFGLKGVAKAVLAIMMILTGIYISAVAYANSSTSPDVSSTPPDVVYNADLYRSETPPSTWYTPEQLGIIGVMEFGPDEYLQLQISVDREKEPFPLQKEQPIFLYKGRFFRVSPHWTTPGLENDKDWEFLLGGTLGGGWVFAGALFAKWRKKK